MNNKRGKKIIKRKPGSGPSANYFTKETEEAAIQFKYEENVEKKHEIFVDKIYEPFKKLVENLINVYNYKTNYETKEELRDRCVAQLFQIISKFDETKGSKAFSYYNVVAKHYLIVEAKQATKHSHSLISLEDTEAFSNHEIETIENYKVDPSSEDTMIQNEKYQEIKEIISEMQRKTTSENEKLVLASIEQIISNINSYDDLTKKTALSLLRDATLMNNKQLSTTLSTLKKVYKQTKKEVENI
ncbi:MAG TPA: hypothetical protein PLP33_10540 [Leptospiraceae bacterium]|nr:hypothetical protein [Leptospiraceae bacterium]